ncbi:CLUMA_CG001107, isoform A [Clunio marinus]|uniref:CLUMA_CG001107, isoform A n=1 Tax=Clunio marinus TaxID=568069 RepID=A0A1J1HM54_9DIPT|nr:CLUMA_CG001107, isoform A [Clunio marinus]
MDKNHQTNEAKALQEAIRKRLAENGKLEKIRSEIRSLVLKDVREGDDSPINTFNSKNLNSSTQFANHFIIEYFEWMGFQYSKEMFMTESGCCSSTISTSRDVIESKIRNEKAGDGFDKDFPMLLSIIRELFKKH